MFTNKRFQHVLPVLTKKWEEDGPKLLRILNEYFLSLEQPGALSISEAEITNSSVPDVVSVKDPRFRAKGDGVADDTAAIQAALDTGKHVWFPAGEYKTTAALEITTVGQILSGDGMELSKISYTGAGIEGITCSAALTRCQIRDMWFSGGAGTGNALDFSAATELYESVFRNIRIDSVGKCIYAPQEFNNLYENIQFSSSADNGIEISGSNTTTLLNCYAHTFAALKYPYRIYGTALMISCNGVDDADYIVLAGKATAKGDDTDVQYRLTCINCNFEDFKKNAVQLRYNGTFISQNCSFIPPAVATSATYDCCVYCEFNDILWLMQGGYVASKGSTKNKLANLFSEAGQAPMCFNFEATWDNNTTLSSIPNMTTSIAEFARYALTVKDVKATGSAYVANYLEFDEIAAPGASTANKGRLYLRDDGTGKTQMCAVFPNGTVQVIGNQDGTEINAGVIVTAATPTVAAGQIGIGTTTSATVGAAGGAAALPANPQGYLSVNFAGVVRKIPYYLP